MHIYIHTTWYLPMLCINRPTYYMPLLTIETLLTPLQYACPIYILWIHIKTKTCFTYIHMHALRHKHAHTPILHIYIIYNSTQTCNTKLDTRHDRQYNEACLHSTYTLARPKQAYRDNPNHARGIESNHKSFS